MHIRAFFCCDWEILSYKSFQEQGLLQAISVGLINNNCSYSSHKCLESGVKLLQKYPKSISHCYYNNEKKIYICDQTDSSQVQLCCQ